MDLYKGLLYAGLLVMACLFCGSVAQASAPACCALPSVCSNCHGQADCCTASSCGGEKHHERHDCCTGHCAECRRFTPLRTVVRFVGHKLFHRRCC